MHNFRDLHPHYVLQWQASRFESIQLGTLWSLAKDDGVASYLPRVLLYDTNPVR